MPVDPSRYLAFVGVITVLCLAPGPANLFALATGLRRGHRAVLTAVLGMNAASLVWYAGAALGLSALMAAFPGAFRVLTLLGVAYLAWLGARALVAAARGGGPPKGADIHADRSALVDGFLVQIANPKILVFFSAVLPPFIDTQRPLGPQLLLFACTTFVVDPLAMTGYGLGGAALSDRMGRPGFQRGFQLAVGLLLLTAAGLVLSRL